ncbi:MAG: hypothetical protein ACRCTA_00835, partial [Bacilli bacterium]
MKYKIDELKIVPSENENNNIYFIEANKVDINSIPDFIYNLLIEKKSHTQIDIYNEYIYGNIMVSKAPYALISRLVFYYYKGDIYFIYDELHLDLVKLLNALNDEIDNYYIDKINNKIIIYIILNL